MPFVLAVLVLVGCQGTIDQKQVTPVVSKPMVTATPWPTPTPKPDRFDCSAIVGSEYFISLSEKDWFIDNCLVGPPESFLYNQILGIGARVMEIYSVDMSVCSSGLVSFTAFHRPNLEAFSYLFRNFCSSLDPTTLAFPPPPFACATGENIEAIEVDLGYMDGRVRQELEVFCVSTDDPNAAPAEPATFGLIDEALWTTR